LTFSRTDGLNDIIDLPAGLHVSDQSGKITFTTLEPIHFARGATETGVSAVHADRVEAEIIGQGNGDGGQSVTLRRAPVLRRLGTLEELRIGVEHLGGDLASDARTVSIDGKVFVLWDEVSSFSGQVAAHCYVADRTSGRVTFAASSGAARAVSATLAEVPAAGAQIRAWYLSGGGRVGNVAIGTLNTLRERYPGLDVTNRERAAGGEDAEVPEAFLTRGRDAVRSLDCAVTADDFTQIALSSGGVARARAFAQRDTWVFGQPGLVEVLVIPQVNPDSDTGAVTALDLQANRTDLLRERIATVIGEKCPIGVRTDIKWGNCLPVSVAGRIAAAPSEDINALAARITKRLNTLLSPLGNWPFGKSLRVSDIYEAILDDPGVRFAEQVTLTTDDGPQGETTRLFSDPHQPRCIYALMGDGLYRSLDYATSWERILSWPDKRPVAIAADQDVPGCIAVAGSAVDGTSQLSVSNTCGESWIDLETIQHQVNDIAFVNQDGRRWIFIATRNGLFRTDCLGPRGLLGVKVAGGTLDSGGFYAVSSGSNQASARFVALAARGKGGVFLSPDGVNFAL
ncbi:MAG: baseplate J/gp47 family protein, partial [Deltaproteobacteria bacterium]